MPARSISPLTAAYLPFSAGDLLGPFLISQAVYFFVIFAVLLVLMASLLAEFQLRGLSHKTRSLFISASTPEHEHFITSC